MDAVGDVTPGARWAPAGTGGRRDRLGSASQTPGHVVGVLALIGLAAYGVLIMSVLIRTLPSITPPVMRWAGLVGWLLWMAGYVWSIVTVLRGRRHDRAIQVVALANLVWSFLLFLLMGEPFSALPALSFSVMLLCLAGRVRGIVTVVSLIVYFALTVELIHIEKVKNVEEFALSALIFYAIPRLVIFAGELEDTRAELARLAVSEQRLRWARDLHDTLGHGLSVVVLKLDLVERLNAKDPERAARELLDARGLLRESIGEMQTVVAGMRDISLSGEIANAGTILNSAGVTTTTDIDPAVLDARVANALAWIVREGATNVLRHSDSTACHLTLRVTDTRAILTLTNDGPPIRSTRAPSGGHGLRGMRERLAVLGGVVSAGPRPGGGYKLVARVPVSPDARAGRAEGTGTGHDASEDLTTIAIRGAATKATGDQSKREAP